MSNEEGILEKALKDAIEKAYKEGYEEGIKENKRKKPIVKAKDAEHNKFYTKDENIFFTTISVDGDCNRYNEYFYFLRLKIDPDSDMITQMRVDLIEEDVELEIIDQEKLPSCLKRTMDWIEF